MKLIDLYDKIIENFQIDSFKIKVNDLNLDLDLWFYVNGNLRYIGNRINRKPHGEWKRFYENGNLSLIENYENGELHGEPKLFWDNGDLLNYENLKCVQKYKKMENLL
ncbi:MAG: hypothetical protein MI923_18080 [Phycisphaerales bacterium]|nr:hypothetical protein [Phycisphaerales bacterium]